MRQTLAIFVDAYRELNSKKLFWISLFVSLGVVIALALPVQVEKGISIFGAKLESGPMVLVGSKAISASAFYKFLYSWFGINLWLGWGATILALISTASMIPDLISSGSIELTLAKPMGRLRLFLTKYAAGLVFVGLQAAIFAVGAILVIGLRSGLWDARPLLIVPIMATFFSFLHCVSVLVGLLTRSTLMSLLAVLVMWLFFWALGSAEVVFLGQRDGSEREVTRIQEQQRTVREAIATLDQQILRLAPATAPKLLDAPDIKVAPSLSPAPGDASAVKPLAPDVPPQDEPGNRPRRDARLSTKRMLDMGQKMIDAATDTNADSVRVRRDSLRSHLSSLEAQLPSRVDDFESARKWHSRLYTVYTIFPKTGETKDLFQRWVIDKSDWDGFLKMLDQMNDSNGRNDAQDALNKRPLWWVLGTSFGFELVVLGIAAWIFCRRDF